mgnify:CR=1 FL=1
MKISPSFPEGGGAIYSLTAKKHPSGRNICGKKEEKDILPLMRELGIEQLKDAYPSELSGGELRRVAIARARFQGTGILLADEPTSDLDEENTDIVAKLLRRAADSGKRFCRHPRDGYAALCRFPLHYERRCSEEGR